MNVAVSEKFHKCEFKNVLYIPDLRLQIISVCVLDKLGYTILFQNRQVLIRKKGTTAATGSLSDLNLYSLDLRQKTIENNKAFAASLQTIASTLSTCEYY